MIIANKLKAFLIVKSLGIREKLKPMYRRVEHVFKLRFILDCSISKKSL